MSRFSSITRTMNSRFKERMEYMSILRPVLEKIEIWSPVKESFDKTRHIDVSILDIEGFVKQNELAEITNPVFFIRDNYPTPDGLLSNEIFGISKADRSGTFAYIDLGDVFMHPLCYKVWTRLDSKIRDIVHGIKNFIIDEHGALVENEKGKTGVKFLKDNFEKIKIKSTGTVKRDVRIEFLKDCYKKNVLFVSKWPVIPAYYRDVDTSRGRQEVGEINQMYSALLNASRALKSSVDYGLTLSGATRGRIQECLLNIYNWFTDEPQLSKKFGTLKRAGLSKTTDYSCRLVISAPNLHGERLEDVMVDVDHCALPLAAAITNFFPFVMYYLTSFFNQEFAGKTYYNVVDEKGEIQQYELDNWQDAFSPVNIKKQIDRYIHGFSNRFIPIEVPVKNSKKPIYMRFKGLSMSSEEFAKTNGTGEAGSIVSRKLTWCDLFYIAAVQMTKDKCVLITRFPIDSCYNQYPSLVRISSTTKTESMVVDGEFYPHFPYIRDELIGTNTSNLFIDTLQLSNAMIKIMGGDYDGDQVTVKGVFYEESNAELRAYINSPKQFIDLSGINMRISSKEANQCLYNLTLILPGTPITESVEMT